MLGSLFSTKKLVIIWITWVAGSTLGWVISWMVSRTIKVNDAGFSILLGGLLVGAFQWLVLSNKSLVAWRQKSWLWIPLSVVTWILAIRLPFSFDLPYYVESFIFGLLVGIIQWILLRFYFQRAYIWIIASAIGWMLAAIINIAAAAQDSILGFSTNIALVTGGGLVLVLYLGREKILDNSVVAPE